MAGASDVLVYLHALGGVVALASMWVPLCARKGGALHRKVGLVYAWSMAWVCASALAGSCLRLVDRPEEGQGPLFLSLVAIQSGAATWWGVAVLRDKDRASRSTSAPDWIAAVALVASGVLSIVYWSRGAMFLFALFGALNLVFGLRFANVLGRAPRARFWWWYEHLFGMVVACIGTVTAFLVVNYGHAPVAVQSAIPSIVVWTAPGLVGGLAIAIWMRHYRAKLEPRQR
jgi:hypothetical protein